MGKSRSKKLRARAKKAIRVTHKYVGRAIAVAAPIVGAALGGPAGAALGTAVGTASKAYGEGQGARAKGKRGKAVKKAQRRGAKGALMFGGAVTGGALIGAIAGGTGLTTGTGTALSNIFGKKDSTGKSTGGTPEYSEILTQDSLYPPGIPGGPKGPAGANNTDTPKGGILDTVGSILGTTLGGLVGNEGEDKNENGVDDSKEIAGVPIKTLLIGGAVILGAILLTRGGSSKAA